MDCVTQKGALIIAYAANNLGDDMFVEILCKRYPQQQFYIICNYNNSACFVKIKNLKTIYENSEEYNMFYKHIDRYINMQILIGGSLFMQPQNRQDINQKFESVKNSIPSPYIPFVILGANFGPFTEQQHIENYKTWFPKAQDICFRDLQSYQLFQNIKNTRWAPDILLGYPLQQYTPQKRIVISSIYDTKRIGLPSYPQDIYFDLLAQVTKKYLDDDYDIVLAAFCVNQKDDLSSQEILKRIPVVRNDRVRIISYNGDIEAFLKVILEAKYIIGTRFHCKRSIK